MNATRAWWLPLLAAALSLLTIHLTYLVAAAHGHVDWCWPWFGNCSSISATGRQLPEKLLFKPPMMLAALLVGLTLWLAARWLQALGDTARRQQQVIVACGVVAAACIAVYTAALGEAGDSARLLRRVGVTLGFGLSFLAELLLLARIAAVRRRAPALVATGPYRAMLAIMAAFLLLGLLNVGWQAVGTGYTRVDNALEWWFALLINAFLLPLALLWRRQDVRLQVHADLK